MRRPVAAVLKLPVEMIQQVAHELMGILLLVASVKQSSSELHMCKDIGLGYVAPTVHSWLSWEETAHLYLKLGMIFQMA